MIQSNFYNTNKVMQLIGQQRPLDYMGADFGAALEAHLNATDPMDNELSLIAVDFYLLGIITGKRLERAAKNGREYAPITETA